MFAETLDLSYNDQQKHSVHEGDSVKELMMLPAFNNLFPLSELLTGGMPWAGIVGV
ncbi:hypothetical protein JCM12856_02550 [Spirochaeta dissipatitropha]